MEISCNRGSQNISNIVDLVGENPCKSLLVFLSFAFYRVIRGSILCIALLIVLASSTNAQWVRQSVNTTASFRGLSVVNEKIVWASGTGGTVINTKDGGKTWSIVPVPGMEKLDFRDVEAFDANTAYVLSIGEGENSRIYKTIDGGKIWQLQFINKDPKAFFDAIACWDKNNCIAMSDPVDGKYLLISTKNGGSTWTPLGTDKMPEAKQGEAAFAASGTCLITRSKMDVFLVTGGTDARVFRSDNRGLTWFVSDTPIAKGTPGTGIFSIAFRNSDHGTIVGGNYEKPGEKAGSLAFTSDSGKSWYAGEGLSGYRSGVTYIDDQTLIAVGTSGSDISYNRGKTWQQFGTEDLNAVQAKGKTSIWSVGPKGAVFKLENNK